MSYFFFNTRVVCYIIDGGTIGVGVEEWAREWDGGGGTRYFFFLVHVKQTKRAYNTVFAVYGLVVCYGSTYDFNCIWTRYTNVYTVSRRVFPTVYYRRCLLTHGNVYMT